VFWLLLYCILYLILIYSFRHASEIPYLPTEVSDFFFWSHCKWSFIINHYFEQKILLFQHSCWNVCVICYNNLSPIFLINKQNTAVVIFPVCNFEMPWSSIVWQNRWIVQTRDRHRPDTDTVSRCWKARHRIFN
jgi:hypothetical protein